jgi:protein-tyrosine-phosphatase
MAELPGSVLFVCSMNAIRSPMAEAILKFLHGTRLFVDSAGVRRGELDPLAVEVLDEIGIDLSRHRPKTLDQLEDGFFDLVVTLSPEAHHRALEMTRDSACEVELWRLPDPSLAEGSREQRLDAYRAVRDQLLRRIRARFPMPAAPSL